jgi:hypothetical protein
MKGDSQVAMEYSRGTAFLNLLPDSRLRQAVSISLHQSPGTVPAVVFVSVEGASS